MREAHTHTHTRTHLCQQRPYLVFSCLDRPALQQQPHPVQLGDSTAIWDAQGLQRGRGRGGEERLGLQDEMK